MPRSKLQALIRLDRGGFTLIELVIIIVILGILAGVAVPRFVDMAASSKAAATKHELQNLREALVGNPSVTVGGQLVDCGFEGDVGFLPSRLVDLVIRPDSVSVYNPITGLGWNGPYIDGSNDLYLKDAWDVAYVYLPDSRLLLSLGGPDTLLTTF